MVEKKHFNNVCKTFLTGWYHEGYSFIKCNLGVIFKRPVNLRKQNKTGMVHFGSLVGNKFLS